MGTKIEGDGCYERAMPDEPMFVLLARDPSAPRYVELWALQREGQIEDGTHPASDATQVAEARALSKRMREWRIQADEAWRKQPELAFPEHADLGVSLGHKGMLDSDYPLPTQHHEVRQGDEYFCRRCSKRWGVDEDAPETCS